jgi:hypothetical protein
MATEPFEGAGGGGVSHVGAPTLASGLDVAERARSLAERWKAEASDRVIGSTPSYLRVLIITRISSV